jgi:hypothetical protein
MYINDLHQFLDQLADRHFFGVIEIKYESGHVATIRKTESLKVTGDEPIRFREASSEQHSSR